MMDGPTLSSLGGVKVKNRDHNALTEWKQLLIFWSVREKFD